MLFKERQVAVVAASADPLERATEVAASLRLTFPLAYGIDAERAGTLLGLTVNRDNKFVQPAAFILKPDRTIACSTISSWAVGRLRPEEVWGAIHYLGKLRA
jgi:peroxiredoxin